MVGNTRPRTPGAMPRLLHGVRAWLFRAGWQLRLSAAVLILAAAYVVSSSLLVTPPPSVLNVGLKQIAPFMYTDEMGRAAGALPDLLNAAAARAGMRLRWVEYPDSADSAMQPGSGIDIWPILEVTKERRKRFHLTQPFARGDMLLVRLAGQKEHPIRKLGLRDWPEVREWARREYPQAQPEVRGQGSGLLSLCEGRLDATLVETPVFDAFLMKRPAPCANARFEIKTLTGFGTDYGLGSTFQAAASADLLRQKVGEMAREGNFDEIFQRYYPLAHYRSAESFAETHLEKASRLYRWGAGVLLVLCMLLWVAIQRLRRRAHEALAMADLRSRFLASISHELRTPLNGVLGIASVLSSTALDRTQREYVGLIRSSGEILLRTVNEVLDFSRLEAGKRLITLSPVHLESLAEEVLSILSPVAYQKDLELAWAVDPDVPADILSDETALRQILMNLLGNALKFTDRGSVELRMQRVPIGSGSDLLRIAVSDTGPGIPPGQELSIFDPYIRSENASTQAAVGTGLGLSITKHLVLLFGGTLSVANTPGGGCTFTVELPITPALDPPGLEARSCSSRPLFSHALVLTRRAITGEMLARRLEGAGCRVTHLSTAHAALRAVDARHPWDLLVIDTALDGDGLEIAQRLKRNQPDSDALAILLTTGKRETDALNREIPAGYAVYPKPFLPELFCSLLEKASLSPGPNRASLPEASKSPTAPRNSEPHPAGLLQLRRATLPVAELPPGCAPDGLGCDTCSRDNTKSMAACVAAALPSGGAPRVLIADDNPVNRKVITSMLRSMGIACDAVGSGEDALNNFSAAPYSWIVMDWHMPGMDGLSTIEKIRQRELRDHLPRTPIILCTATNEQDDRLAGWRDAFEEILPKPISLKSLRKALILSARRAPRAQAGQGETSHASASPQSAVPPA